MAPRHLFSLLLLCCALPAQAQIYTWVDENGQKHFGNQPPTPEKQVETVKIRQGYSSDGPQPAVVQPQADEQTEASQKPSQREMCKEAMRWTAIDIPNLKEIAEERKKDGKITSDQLRQANKALDEVDDALTLQNCMASEGEDLERFECLSHGAGIMVCSGALEAALNGIGTGSKKE